MSDGRPLYVRVRAIAQEYDAIVIGLRKRMQQLSSQDIPNAERRAATLHEAANKLEKRE